MITLVYIEATYRSWYLPRSSWWQASTTRPPLAWTCDIPRPHMATTTHYGKMSRC